MEIGADTQAFGKPQRQPARHALVLNHQGFRAKRINGRCGQQPRQQLHQVLETVALVQLQHAASGKYGSRILTCDGLVE